MPDAGRKQPVMQIRLADDRRARTIEALRSFFREEFDEDLSSFRAERLLDFVMKSIGPPLYNQAVADARAYMLSKLDDIDGELYEPDER